MDNINLARLEKLKNSYGVLKRVSLDEYKLIIEMVRDEIAGETEQVVPVRPVKSDFELFRQAVFNDPSDYPYGTSELNNDPFGWGLNDDDWNL